MNSILKNSVYFLFLLIFFSPVLTIAQTPDSLKTKSESVHYPEIKGYIGIVHPLYGFSGDGNHPNFQDYYVVGNPWGINIWKNKKLGFTFEFTPFIRNDKQGGVRMSNFLFHPGILYRLGNEFTLIGRAAYETSGKFGFTPIINKVFYRSKGYSLFAALLLPVRYGQKKAPVYTVAFQFGIGF